MTWPDGVTAHKTQPISYTVNYLNGSRTYKEPFVVINCKFSFINGTTIEEAVKNLVGFVNLVPYIGPALQAIANWGIHWFVSSSFNNDGSLSLAFAYHYCGTRAGGIDLTATPIPGVPPEVWQGVVDDLMKGIEGTHDAFVISLEPKPIYSGNSMDVNSDGIA